MESYPFKKEAFWKRGTLGQDGQALALKQNQGQVHVPLFPLTYTPASRCSKRSELRKAVPAQSKDLITSKPANLDLHLRGAKASRQVRPEVGVASAGGFPPSKTQSASNPGGQTPPRRGVRDASPGKVELHPAAHAFPTPSARGGSRSRQGCGGRAPGPTERAS